MPPKRIKPDRPLTAIARRIRKSVLTRHPSWKLHECSDNQDLCIYVPAPRASKIEALQITTYRQDIWVGFVGANLRNAFYAVDNSRELLRIVELLLNDAAMFLITERGSKWIETTLVGPNDRISVKARTKVTIFSWSGKFDRVIVGR